MMNLDDATTTVTAWLQSQLSSNPQLRIPDQNKVIMILAQFLSSGIDKFSIVSDFDYTLTKMWAQPGVKCLGGHNILSLSNVVTPQFTEKLQELASRFMQYETSLTLSWEEKSAQLVNWYRQVHQVIIDEGINKESLEEMARQVPTHYRDGVKEFFSKTEALNVPLLLCSAGVMDIIDALLKHDKLLTTNTFIASNEMIFSKEPPHNVIDFREPYVHVYNKGDYDVSQTTIYESLCQRPNLLLMGDSLGDVSMGNRIPYQHLLRIGFLNSDEDNLLPHYAQAFDIILTGDTTLDFPNQLITLIS